MSRHAARRRNRFHAKCRKMQHGLVTAPLFRRDFLSGNLRRMDREWLAVFWHPDRVSLRPMPAPRGDS